MRKMLNILKIMLDILGIIFEAGMIALILLFMFSILFLNPHQGFISFNLTARIIIMVIVMIVWAISTYEGHKERVIKELFLKSKSK